MFKENAFKPAIILIFFMMITCLSFWMSSRYPELSEKTILSDSPILSSLGFFPIFEIQETDPIWKKVLLETGNWINTNKKGMSFSFFVGAFLLCLWPLFKRGSFNHGFNNSLLGLGIGAPLGICVNCAAPVARALYGGGSTMQTALSTLIASPTLNIVVLTMALSLFPVYVIVTKIILTLIFILILIPMACRYFFQTEIQKHQQDAVCDITDKPTENIGGLPQINGWSGAGLWALKHYIKNFFFLLKVALPLMILSGALGSLATILVPWSSIETLDQYDSIGMMILALPLIALLGTILPAPMAFDVILASALLQANVPIQYVSIILFTLGSFSIYAFFIIWRSMSLRIALFLMITTMILGICMGIISMYFDNYARKTAAAHLNAYAQEHDFDPIKQRTDHAYSLAELQLDLDKHHITFTNPPKTNDLDVPNHLTIKSVDHAPSTPKTNQENFTLIKGIDKGIEQPYEVSYITGMPEALAHTTMSVATGDVHQDGWPDILLTGDLEIHPNLILYANIGGQQYKRQHIPLPPNINEVILVALVDLNGDTWLDIVFATYGGQNYVIYNDKGEFIDQNIAPLYPENLGSTMSLAFGDIEKDGDLDIFLGNWNVGPRYSNFSHSQNILLRNENPLASSHNQKYVVQRLNGSTGETLTSLFHDFDNDGYLDLYVGNDFSNTPYSDIILNGQKTGHLFIKSTKRQGKIDGSHSTMSIDIGDIDNDLKPDFYIGQIAFMGHYEDEMHKVSEKQILYHQYCDKNNDLPFKQCMREMKLKYALAAATHISDTCQWLDNEEDQTKCLIHLINYQDYCQFSITASAPSPKDNDGTLSPRYKSFCDLQEQAQQEFKKAVTEKDKFTSPHKNFHLKAANWSLNNVLLYNESSGTNVKLTDQSDSRNAGYGGWTWNARFGDLDNDGWQDIYLVNGHSFQTSLATNIFYHNKGMGHYEDETTSFGLENYTVTTAFSYADLDFDGDLDIVNVPLDAPVQIYRNNNPKGYNAIRIQLIDEQNTNKQAIGAHVIISYKTAKKETMQQLGIVQGGGGSKSYNQPVLHFGLGTASHINKVEIKWPDGTQDVIKGKILANKTYHISRR
ncbi:MAG: FG-GAP-like repeat-containing protein [Alphaproteobacteria bacterium]